MLTASYNRIDNKTLGKGPGKQIQQQQGLLGQKKKKNPSSNKKTMVNNALFFSG